MWSLPKPPANELRRLEILEACSIMDTPQDERFDRLIRLASSFYGADVAFIGLIDADYQWIKAVNSDEIAPIIERRNSVCNLMVESGEPLVVGDMKTDPRLDGHPIVPMLTLRFYAGVPLLAEGDHVIGSFCVLRREAGRAEEFDLAPLIDLAAVAVDEIELHRLNRELARLAQIDALTGLTNRRGFDAALDRAVRRTRRTGAPLSLIVIDLDRFKVLNDAFGHPAGDAVLRQLGGALAGAANRPYDTASRYGGEEFVLILPDTDAAGARRVAERVRDLFAQAALPHPLGGCVTASFGIATTSGPLADAGRLLADADGALYEAKRRGRDCAVESAALIPLAAGA